MSADRETTREGRRYRSSVVAEVRLDRGARLIRTLTGAVCLVPPVHAELVSQCLAFKSLRDHARDRLNDARLHHPGGWWSLGAWLPAAGGAPATERGMTRLLSQLADTGLLIEETEARPPLASEAAPARIDTIGILTRNRPQQTLACVDAYAARLATSGRAHSWIIADDSDPAYEQEMAQVVAEAARRTGQPVLHLNRRMKRALAARLARAGCAPALAEWALLGPDGVESRQGANANALALASAGRPLLVIADPTALRLRRRPWIAPGIRFESRRDPRRPEFFIDRNDLQAMTADSQADLIHAHEQVLGASPGECAARIGPSIEWAADLDATTFQYLLSGRGRIRLSVNGIAGAGAWQWAAHVSACPDHQPNASAALLNQAFNAGAAGVYSHTVDAVTIGRGACCLAPCVAFDHRALLPPFMPVGHDPESVFMRVAAGCDDGLLAAFLPIVSVIQPRYRRVEGGSMPGLGAMASAALDSCGASLPGGSPADGLRRIGRYLVDLTSLNGSECERCVRHLMLDRMAQAAEPDMPGHGYIRGLAEWMGPSSTLRVADLVDGLCTDHSMTACQHALNMYGQLLLQWADLIGAARALQPGLEALAIEDPASPSSVTQSLTTG
jgi:hypothetical protein